MNKINPFFSLISQEIHKMYNKHSKFMLQNMNKIITFFSEIAQIVKIYENITIITKIWDRDKFYFTCISGPWYLIMVPNMKKIHPTIMEECTMIN